jgi:hypothetical protein
MAGRLRLANAFGDAAAIQHIGNHDLGARGGQAVTEGRANAARAAGDDCYFVLESGIHVFFPQNSGHTLGH